MKNKLYRATFSANGPLAKFRIRIPETFKAPNIYDAYEKALEMARRKHCELVEIVPIEA